MWNTSYVYYVCFYVYMCTCICMLLHVCMYVCTQYPNDRCWICGMTSTWWKLPWKRTCGMNNTHLYHCFQSNLSQSLTTECSFGSTLRTGRKLTERPSECETFQAGKWLASEQPKLPPFRILLVENLNQAQSVDHLHVSVCAQQEDRSLVCLTVDQMSVALPQSLKSLSETDKEVYVIR
jgi:hypothetical protein